MSIRKADWISMNGKLLNICLCALLCVACKERAGQSFNLSEAEYLNSVVLMNPIEPLERLNSLAIIDNDRFVLCTENQVYLYEDGEQKEKIGRCGKASNEYVYPMIVRVNDNHIYVWCAMTLRFLDYSLDGNCLDSYQYDSAISDFNCRDGKIIIYTNGTKNANTVEVYDMQTRRVMNSFAETTEEHRALLPMFSVAPLMRGDACCYFSPKDKLEIYSLDISENEMMQVSHKTKSESFRVNGTNVHKNGYVDDNSFVVALIGVNGSMKIMASEGKYTTDAGMKDKTGRFYSIYSFRNGVIDYQKSITAESLGSPSLFSFYDGRLYYIINEISGEDEHYELRQLEI